MDSEIFELSNSPSWEDFEALSLPKSYLDSTFSQKLESDVIYDWGSSSEDLLVTVKRNAEAGLSDAQYKLGLGYENGIWLRQSYQESFKHLKLAADQGHSLAQLSLIYFYERGLGTKQSYEKAFYYCKLLADAHDPYAMAKMGNYYQKGLFVEKSSLEALRLYEKAEKEECSWAYQFLADTYLFGIGVESSDERSLYYKQKNFECHQYGAELGIPQEIVRIGKFYERGYGVEKSLNIAVEYYERASDQNYPQGQVELGRCYECGIGVNQSIEKALDYYKRAADRGFVFAQYKIAHAIREKNLDPKELVYYLKLILQTKYEIVLDLMAQCQYYLACCFENGEGIAYSARNALYYYKLAAKNGNKLAQSRVGQAYLLGDLELEIDRFQAYKFLDQCYPQSSNFTQPKVVDIHKFAFSTYGSMSSDKDKMALFFRGRCFEEGLGTSVSIKNHIRYYTLASELGVIQAHVRLAKYYAKIESHEKAFEYYQKASNAGHSESQYQLGIIYEYGLGIDTNFEEAFKYYKLSACQGNAKALCSLAGCFEKGRGTVKSLTEAFKCYKKAADKNDACGQYNLGCCYLWGIGCKRSLDKAQAYLNLALIQNYEVNQTDYLIAYCRKNKTKIVTETKGNLLTQKADVIQTEENLNLFVNQLFSIQPYPQNEEEIKNNTSSGLEQYSCNISETAYQEGVAFEYEHDQQSKAFVLYQKAAIQGHSEAQFALGRLYSLGMGTEVNFTQAVKYLELSANQGNERAFYILGKYFEKGIGVIESDQQALEYFHLAANRKYIPALLHLAKCYENGLGVTKSATETFKYYKLAADEGYEEAQELVAIYYRYGYGCEKSLSNAKFYYLKIFKNLLKTIANPCNGLLKLSEANAIPDFETLIEIADKSEGPIFGFSHYFLGYYYQQGIVVHQSLTESIKHYILAARNGNIGGLLSLGDICYNPHPKICPRWAYFYYNQIQKYLKLEISKECLSMIKETNLISQQIRQYYEYSSQMDTRYLENKDFEFALRFDESNETDESLKTKTIQFYSQLGEQGIAHGYYRAGFGAATDKEGWEFYRLAADMGHPLAQFEYAKHLDKHKETIKEALHYYIKSFENGFKEASYDIFRIYSRGVGVEKSEEEAFKFCKIAAEAKIAEAYHYLSLYYKDGKIVDKSDSEELKWLKLAADDGVGAAQYQLAVYYEKGEKIEQSYKQAYHYYALAAKNCYTPAYYSLAKCHHHSLGTKGDMQVAREFYEKAQLNGYDVSKEIEELNDRARRIDEGDYFSEAFRHFPEKAFIYFKVTSNGKKILWKDVLKYYLENEPDPENSIFFLTKMAVDKGLDEAIYSLALCYLEGFGTEKSEKKGLEYLKLAAEKGDYQAHFYLGLLYEGDFLIERKVQKELSSIFDLEEKELDIFEYEPNLIKACKHYFKAAEHGHLPAIYKLGDCYFFGVGVDQSYKKALDCYIKATHLQNIYKGAQFDAGYCYDHGLGTNLNKSEAEAYYNFALREGDSRALCRQSLLHEKKGDYKKAVDYLKTDTLSEQIKTHFWLVIKRSLGLQDSREEILESYKAALFKDMQLKNNSFKENAFLMEFGTFYYPLNPFTPFKGLPDTEIIFPFATEINITHYLLDRDIKILESILNKFRFEAVILKDANFSEQELNIVCEAMIKNPCMTFLCDEKTGQVIINQFQSLGYEADTFLKIRKISKSNDLYGFLFNPVIPYLKITEALQDKTISALPLTFSDLFSKIMIGATTVTEDRYLDLIIAFADQGNVIAQLELAFRFLLGQEMKNCNGKEYIYILGRNRRQFSKSFSEVIEFAENQFSEVPILLNDYIKYLEIDAARGNQSSRLQLAKICEEENILEDSKHKAAYYYCSALNESSNGIDKAKAKVKNQFGEYCYKLGNHYEKSTNDQQGLEFAVFYYSKAAEQDNK